MARILIVDDEQNIREVVREYCELNGYEADEAEDGMEAIEKVRTAHYDCVILDVMMPKLDGFSTCREIKRLSNIPVIMLSARTRDSSFFMLGASFLIFLFPGISPATKQFILAENVLSRNRQGIVYCIIDCFLFAFHRFSRNSRGRKERMQRRQTVQSWPPGKVSRVMARPLSARYLSSLSKLAQNWSSVPMAR